MKKWYVIYNGQQIGPMSENELLAYNLTPQTQVWQEGMPQWQPLYAFPELMAKINQQSNIPPTPGIPPVYKTSTTGKDKIAAGLLALFLGGLGIHYFYCGKSTAGLLTILLSIVTCGIWQFVMFILGIMILVMPQEEFENKYVLTDKNFPLF